MAWAPPWRTAHLSRTSTRRAAAFRIHGERIDGTNVLAVRDAVRRLRQKAEQEGEPAILDITSFRFRGHSVIDADRYRDADAVRRGREAFDPVRNFGALLNDQGIADGAFLKETAEQIDREVQEAIDFANASPEPKVEDLYTYMYASPVPNIPGPEDAVREVKINRGEI